MRARILLACCIFLLVTSCTTPLKDWDPTDYTVKSGDTLYSIAWRYEIDPADLARWNRLQSASLIHPGQRLHTRKPKDYSVSRAQPAVDPQAEYIEVVQAEPARKTWSRPAMVTVQQDQTLYGIARKHGVPVSDIIAANKLKKPYTIYPGQQLKLSAQTKTVAKQTDRPKATRRKRLTWQWPVKGKVVKRFNRNRLDARGIEIAGKRGREVRAAAGGKVVYSGNGLISYGNLVIIKHNNTYLSAYANNDKLLVKEGAWVEQGQKIAHMGTVDGGKAALHFEIRKGGKPVNPLSYLPSS